MYDETLMVAFRNKAGVKSKVWAMKLKLLKQCTLQYWRIILESMHVHCVIISIVETIYMLML